MATVLTTIFSKSRACIQQMSDSLLFFLITAASAEVVSKVSNSNAPRICSHNAMPRNDTDNHTERAS